MVLHTYDENKFTGLASACIRRNLTMSQLESIVDNLEDTLKNVYHVNLIDENVFNVDIVDTDGIAFKQLQEIKPDTSESGLAHDLLLIQIVSAKRPKTLFRASQAKWWVLTDDNKLTGWNAKNAYRKGVPECITESQLATVMWICNPKTSSLDGLFNTVIALKSQGMAGNYEYIRISREIERQKERYAEDDMKLKKLSLVLSQRLLGVEDYMTDDRDELDAKFDQMLIESQDESKEKDMIIAAQERNIESYEKQSASLTRMVEGAQSLLTEQTEKLISSLKKRKDDKQITYEFKQSQINVFENRSKRRIDICTWILKILFATSLICVIYFIIPLIDSLENWHSKHELLYDFFKWIISLLVAVFGFRLEVFDKLFRWKSKKIIVLLEKIKLMKNYGKRIDALDDEMMILLQEMNQIQDEIDNELQKNAEQG